MADSGGQRVTPAYGLACASPPTFRLTPGREYEVYGFALFEKGPAFLVRNDDQAPEWYATSVFEVLDREIPAGWRAGRGEGYELVLTYPELATSAAAMAELVELRQDALRPEHFHQDYDIHLSA
ncbi:hypothetical protein ABZ342_39385 [Amycolatopsis sp. NPDC005961]|uniref:hypothetical protein n=1 Tax=Amycolatopsis sp. NPDC005961 TaxID=3156720 RepID=UPI0033DA636F